MRQGHVWTPWASGGYEGGEGGKNKGRKGRIKKPGERSVRGEALTGLSLSDTRCD